MGEYLRNKRVGVAALVLHAVRAFVGRGGTRDSTGAPADIPPTENEVGMVRKSRDQGSVHRFLPVPTWAQDRAFFRTSRSCTMGVLCLPWEGRLP